MVNKNLDLVDRLTFADAHESYLDTEKEDIYNEIFYENGFAEPDTIVLTGGENEKEEKQRRETFIEYLNEFEGNGNIPFLLTTPSHRRELLQDERVDESDYIFSHIDVDSSLDEIEALKEDTCKKDKVAVITNDYHVPRYEKRLNAALSDNWNDPRDSWFSTAREFFLDHDSEETNDYIVLGAELSENESDYSDKWNSEAFRTVLPQKLKDIGKKYHPGF